VTVFTFKVLLSCFLPKLRHHELKKTNGMRLVREQTSKQAFRERTREVDHYFLSKNTEIDKNYVAQVIFQKSVCLLVQVYVSLET